MRILRLECEDFLSYASVDLDLSEVSTVAVVGKNGHGKSSLAIDMVTFALWGEGRAPTLSKYIRDEGSGQARVRIVFEAGGYEYTVTRYLYASGRGNTVSFTRNGVDALSDGAAEENQAQHTAAEVQAAINRVVGLDYDAVIAGPIMVQGDSDNLIGLGPSKGKDLLIKVAHVGQYEPWHVESKVRSATYARDAAEYARQVATLDATISEESVARAALATALLELAAAKANREAMQAQLLVLRERQASMREKERHSATLRQTIEQLTARIKSDKEEYDRQLRAISAAHQTKDEPQPAFPAIVPVSDADVSALEAEWRRLSGEVGRRNELHARAVSLGISIDGMHERVAIKATVPCGGEGVYATCKFLTGVPTQQAIEDAVGEHEALLGEVAALPDSEAAQRAHDAYMALSRRASEYEKESIRRESAMAQWRIRAEAATATAKNGAASLERLDVQMQRDADRLVRAKEQIGETNVDANTVSEMEVETRSLNDTISEAEGSLSMLYEPAVRRAEESMRTIDSAKARRPDLARATREAQAKADTYALLAKAFHRDGIPTLVVESIIPLIEERANEILGRMPDNYRVRLLTQREKKGGMMDRLTIVVEADGKERDYVMLSGGERFRVDFSLRIALSHVLAHRSGATIQTLIIDEGFGSQDDDGVEAMLESLAAVQEEFGLVLVVTHQRAIIERFETRIEVRKDEDGSHASLVA